MEERPGVEGRPGADATEVVWTNGETRFGDSGTGVEGCCPGVPGVVPDIRPAIPVTVGLASGIEDESFFLVLKQKHMALIRLGAYSWYLPEGQ